VAFQKITFRPGINVQRTQLLNESGWSAANLIRFREGMPEVYGGWQALLSAPLQGVPRGAHAWSTLAGVPTVAVGTSSRLYVIQFNTAYDITPVSTTTTPTNPFTTTMGSATVAVSDPLAQAPQVGDFVEVSGATAVGGLTLSGEYTIATVTGPTTYTVTAATAATSAATGGGAPTLQYLLPIGPIAATPQLGWGIGTWGSGTWGTPRTGGFATAQPRTWTLDNFGEQLIANPRGGGIYVWKPQSGTSSRATLIPGAPTQVNAIFVSNAAEQVVALGSIAADDVASGFDPMLVSWCNSGDYTDWIASATNNAGNFPLTDGSQLMWGGRAAQQNLIWSDTALYSMQAIGGTLAYAFYQLGTNCGMLSPLGAGIVNSVAAWISRLNFMQFNGTVGVIECPVRDAVFKNLDTAQSWKSMCGLNSQFNEFRWDYPSLNGAGENDTFVVWNYVDGTWSPSSNAASNGIAVARTAWQDVSAFGTPVGFDALGNVWSHEVENVYSAGTLAMPWSLESGYADIAAGEQMMFVDWILPDQIMTGGTVDFTFSTQRYSADAPQAKTGTFTTATEALVLRARGRQVAVTFANAGSVGYFWRLGAVRIRAAPDGRN